MGKFSFAVFTGVLLLAMQTSSFAQGGMSTMPDGIKVSEGMLTNSKGMTLYTNDNDKAPGKSVCNGQCLTNWPAVPVAANAMLMGDWTAITRDDGSKQLAYKGKPLYTFARDAMPGDMTGEGVGKVWHMAVP